VWIRLDSTDSDRINEWVAEQMREPWPLNSSQLDVIRRTLSDPRHTREMT
jgi:hypothetical protein